VIDGQKAWTTYAQYANRMFCLVRTDTQAKPQEGISFVLLNMDTPGITVRPLILLTACTRSTRCSSSRCGAAG
jgi:alkylation response protein AidB-like acyl-CoA dehydrogenase